MQTPQARRTQVFRLAMPAVSELVLNTLVGLVDIVLVGQMSVATIAYLGYGTAPALAATGLAGEMFWTMSLLFMAIGTGCTALVARATGAKDPDTANTALRQGLLMGLMSAVLMSIIAIGFAEAIMRVYRAETLVSDLGAQFIRILGYSFVPTAFMMIGMASLRGAGDTRTPLLIMIVVNLVNVGLSYLLIGGAFGIAPLGVEGAAIGASVARTVGGIITLALLLRGRAGLWLRFQFQVQRDMIMRIVRVGWPFAGEQLVFQSALILFIGMINQLGTAAYAAHNLVIRIESLAFLPGWGYGIAASALVGQALGAKRPDEAKAAAHEALTQTSVMMLVLGGVMVAFPEPLLTFFVNDPTVIAAGIIPLQIAGAFQIAMGANFVLSGALRGAGDTRWPLYTKVINTWGLRLPITYILLLSGFGLTGVWIAMGVDFCSQALLAYIRFRQGKWQTMQV